MINKLGGSEAGLHKAEFKAQKSDNEVKRVWGEGLQKRMMKVGEGRYYLRVEVERDEVEVEVEGGNMGEAAGEYSQHKRG